MTERGLFQPLLPPEQRTECQVSVPELKVCRALATDLRALADQLWAQGYREYTRIRLDRETRKIVVELEVSKDDANATIRHSETHS